MPGLGWERVGKVRKHRPGAQRIQLRSLDWRGERIAQMFVYDEELADICQLCDLPIKRPDHQQRWTQCHNACISRAIALIQERRPAIAGSRGHWGLVDLVVAEPGSPEAVAIEERRSAARPALTREQREEAAFLRALAESEK